VTWHDPDESVHEPELENAPEGGPSELKVTVPPVALVVGVSLSDTVAVQVVGLPIDSEPGEQLSVVFEERFVTVTAAPPELPLCFASPPYVPVTVCVPDPTAVGL
jgi:hypothetical protein